MTSEVPIRMGPAFVERMFPFLLALDGALRVAKLGRSVRKVCLDAELDVGLLDILTIVRPQLEPTFAELAASGETFFLDSKTTGVRLRGEMTLDPGTGLLLFLGTPWFSDLARLHASGLTPADFPAHDPTFDLLHMLQAKAAAVQELERANTAKTWFLTNTSHELRTPLNGIIGMATLLQRSELKPKQANFVEKVIKSAEMLQNVVNDVLDIAKIEAGKLTIEELDFEPAELAHDVADMFSTPAHLKDLELVCVTTPHMPGVVRGDPNRLRQVLSNLISNAVKFTSDGEIVVRASVDEILPDRYVQLRFSVSDTGIGIAEEGHKLLFQPFSQIDATTGRRFGGTGLGLAIARQLVELMGGEIGLDSAPGRGSTFWFTVRCPLAAAAERTGAEPLTGLRVLVVDDNATNRAYLSELVAHRGAEVETAASGLDALSALRAAGHGPHPFDLVLLDMHMPGMSGLDVAVMLAADPVFDRLAKVLLTSIDVREDPRMGLAKVRACLGKPVRPEVLAGALLAIRENRSLEPVPGGAPALDVPVAGAGEPEILVVDDNPVNVEVAAHMAETLGYRTEIATTGTEAVRALQRRTYRLVLMDVQMPEMDGYAATREIRQLERVSGARTPIVAMTARAGDSERRLALASGFDDYLPKPIPLETLGALIAKWLGPRDPATPLARPPQAEAPSESDLIDTRAFLQLRRYGRDPHAMISKVVRLFLDDLPLTVRAMLDSHLAGDPAEVRAVAHRMKGSAGLVGAVRLHKLCHDLETAPPDLSEEARARLVDGVLSMSVEVQRALETWLTSQAPSVQP